MASKVKKVEQTEFFISAWEAEPSLWNVMLTIYKDRNAKLASLKNLAEKCNMTGKYYFNLLAYDFWMFLVCFNQGN